jgi:hypothetical protein
MVNEAQDTQALLDRFQKTSYAYFAEQRNPANGLVRDKTAPDWPSSIAVVGVALSAYPVGIERGFTSRADAVAITLTTLRFFATSEQSNRPDATGYRGFYYHFLEMQTGRRAWGSELSSIDTAILIAGVLTSAAYFDGDTTEEREIRSLATQIYERVEWRWMLGRQKTLAHGWKPERRAFLRHRWRGYDESLILQLLAMGSPTHPIDPSCYTAWASTFDWIRYEGIEYLYAGPLFIHHLSQIWLDLRGLRDAFMRGKGSDYFENTRRATQAQQRYAIANPLGLPHLGELCWGISACDGPGLGVQTVNGVRRAFFDYVARGVPYGPDDGTLSPSVVLGSLPFAPEIVLPTVANLFDLFLKAASPYGFRSSVNPLARAEGASGPGWVSSYHFGINEGPVVLMIENYRTGLLWKLMRDCTPLTNGLRAVGFAGGWLDESGQAGDRSRGE